MGLFDVPTPLFGWLDAQLGAVLPAGVRLALWGIIGGVASMLLYRAISAQKRVARGKAELSAAQRALNAYDGEFAGAWPLMRHLLGLAVIQVCRVGWPAVIASLPLLCLLVWLATAYGYRYPDNGAVPEIQTSPVQLHTQWIEANGANAGGVRVDKAPHIVIADDNRQVLADISLTEPVPIIHKRRWWNSLIGNPLGYLPDEGVIDSVSVALPRKEYLAVGPTWMRGWETAFFLPLLVASVALKVLARIE